MQKRKSVKGYFARKANYHLTLHRSQRYSRHFVRTPGWAQLTVRTLSTITVKGDQGSSSKCSRQSQGWFSGKVSRILGLDIFLASLGVVAQLQIFQLHSIRHHHSDLCFGRRVHSLLVYGFFDRRTKVTYFVP